MHIHKSTNVTRYEAKLLEIGPDFLNQLLYILRTKQLMTSQYNQKHDSKKLHNSKCQINC